MTFARYFLPRKTATADSRKMIMKMLSGDCRTLSKKSGSLWFCALILPVCGYFCSLRWTLGVPSSQFWGFNVPLCLVLKLCTVVHAFCAGFEVLTMRTCRSLGIRDRWRFRWLRLFRGQLVVFVQPRLQIPLQCRHVLDVISSP